MDAYFDSAIIVKLYVQEATSPDAVRIGIQAGRTVRGQLRFCVGLGSEPDEGARTWPLWSCRSAPRRNPLDRQGRFAPQPAAQSLKSKVQGSKSKVGVGAV